MEIHANQLDTIVQSKQYCCIIKMCCLSDNNTAMKIPEKL